MNKVVLQFNRWQAGLLGSVVAIDAAYVFYSHTNKNSQINDLTRTTEKLQAQFTSAQNKLDECQKTLEKRMDVLQWDRNWDNRPKVKSGASRMIFLVRHGQYNHGETDEDRTLTELGREQARLAGERLKALGFDYDKIVISTMTRAQETGEIIRSILPDVPVEHTDLIREGFPAPPRPPLKGWELEDSPEHPLEAQRMLDGYRTYIHRAEEEAEKGEATILVCHGNVIRSYVCRALQIPPELWLRLSADNGSITVIKCNGSGTNSLRMFGDVGFMDPKKITYGSSEFIKSLDAKKKSA